MSTQNAPGNLSLDRKPTDSRPNSRLSKKPIRSIRPFRHRAAVLLVATLALALAASLNNVSPRAGLVAAFSESIGTFASVDCTTPKTEWNLGQTACAGVTGAGDERRIVWVAPDGNVADVSAPFTGSGTDTYSLLTSGPFAQNGTWKVVSLDNAGRVYAAASFLVHPTTASADLQILKFGPDEAFAGSNITYTIQVTNQGPDTAQNVVISEPVPNNSTFVSEAQNSGPTAACTNPSLGGTGTSTCTIPSLALNETAIFTFVYNVNATAPVDTLIFNAATISSDTSELFQADNTARYQTAVGSTPPTPSCTITCPADKTVNNNPSDPNPCVALATYSPATTSGNCVDPDTGQTASVVCSPPSGSGFPVGTTTVTCGAGGTTCSFTLTVVDTRTPSTPTITCPSDVTADEASPGAGSAMVNYPAPSATGNCVQVSCSPQSGSSFPVGTTTVTCTATDSKNPPPPNTATCTFTVTVTTVTACTLTCPPDITKPNSPGECGAVATYTTPSGQGCGAVSCDPPSNSFFPVGTTTVICTATDSGGSTIGSCSFTVTVNDTNALTCPANITTTENPPESGSATVNYQEPAACSGATVTCNPDSGSSFLVGTTTVTCTSSSGPTCSFTVTVSSSSCAITCPANKTVNNDPNACGAVVTFSIPPPSGNCGSDPPNCEPPSGSFFPVGATTVTCTSARNGTQCSFTITVNDTQPPVIGSCPANITKSNDPGQCSAVATYTAPSVSDNCSGATVSCNPPSGSTFPKGPTTVTCTAHDAANNTASCTFTVTVNDNQNPTITCPANIARPNDPGLCSAVVSFSATANDNCPGVTYSCNPATGSAFQKGITTVTCTATDTSNNTASCQFTVTVNDTQPPAISCPANINVDFDAGVGGAIVTYATPVGIDNCPGATTTQIAGLPSGATFPVGNTTNTFRVTDAGGLTAECSFKVSVALTSLIGLDSVSITGATLVDSYNSTGGYPATKGSLANVLSNGTITVGGSSRVFGNVRSTRAGVVVSGSSQVTGNATAGTTVSVIPSGTVGGTITNNQLAPVITLPSVPACGPPYSPNTGISGTYSYNPSTGDLSLSGANIATLANGTYCFHNVTLSNSAQLKVTGPVVIKITGTLNAGGASSLTNTTTIPSNLRILSSYTGTNGVALTNSTAAYLVIYAPHTGVTISGAVPLFGTVAGKTLTISNSGMIHYDTLLKSVWPDIWSLIQTP